MATETPVGVGEFSSDTEAFDGYFGGLLDALPEATRTAFIERGEAYSAFMRAQVAHEANPEYLLIEAEQFLDRLNGFICTREQRIELTAKFASYINSAYRSQNGRLTANLKAAKDKIERYERMVGAMTRFHIGHHVVLSETIDDNSEERWGILGWNGSHATALDAFEVLERHADDVRDTEAGR